jgi:hypothetical protein
MLHSLPALLDELERRLVAGEDPLPLLGSIRWPEVIDWPRDIQESRDMKRRLSNIKELIHGLQAPLRATLMGLDQSASYQNRGGARLPAAVSFRLPQSV